MHATNHAAISLLQGENQDFCMLTLVALHCVAADEEKGSYPFIKVLLLRPWPCAPFLFLVTLNRNQQALRTSVFLKWKKEKKTLDRLLGMERYLVKMSIAKNVT